MEKDTRTREAILQLFYKEFILPKAESLDMIIEPEPLLSFGLPTHKKAIGQCWSKQEPETYKSHIFISPILTNTVEIFATLVHEAIHTQISGHGKDFRKYADLFLLAGKPTATYASEELTIDIAEFCGRYSITDFNFELERGGTSTIKKQGTRMIKLECPDCGYTIRTAKKWIEVGLPVCVCGSAFKHDAPEEEEE